MSVKSPYRGRFAPSPTGPLHFGSLLAALASFLRARAAGGEWLVRMEDLDPPREQPGAADDILRTLEAFGFEWNGEVMYQGRREAAYREALDALQRAGAAYPCACTRREIADSSLNGIDGPIYPGTCREGLRSGRAGRAWRVRTEDRPIVFEDVWQGRIERNLARDFGDFVVKRADGFWAYQLAVAVDDAAQGVTEIVRGCDLIESTPRQLWLQQLLGLPTPAYAHLPVAVNARGEKLSKQTFAAPLNARMPQPALIAALHFLGQTAPKELRDVSPRELLGWAIAHWRPAAVPRERTICREGA
jgi:glutamyl-Q tRNA(Asp) synthetase